MQRLFHLVQVPILSTLPAITTTLRMKSYGVIKVMEAEKVIEEKL